MYLQLTHTTYLILLTTYMNYFLNLEYVESKTSWLAIGSDGSAARTYLPIYQIATRPVLWPWSLVGACDCVAGACKNVQHARFALLGGGSDLTDVVARVIVIEACSSSSASRVVVVYNSRRTSILDLDPLASTA